MKRKKTNRKPFDMPYTDASQMYKDQKAALVQKMLNGRCPDFLKFHSQLMDSYFQMVFEMSDIGPQMKINRNPYAIIAQGGYGRQEQCVHSDVDLLVLFGRKVPGEAEALIREMIYPLWDMGLEVGHATRSLKECVKLAGEDMEVLTALLDSRLVCGMSYLYSELKETLRKQIILPRKGKITSWLIERNRERHRNYGDSTYLLEPNLKEGRGGLRDYHTLLWIARINFDLKESRDLEYFGYLSHDEFEELQESLDFIWNVRNRLHHLTGRKCDQLHFEYQEELAKSMAYREANGQQPVEIFLGELHGRMNFIKQQFQMTVYSLDIKKNRGIGKRQLSHLQEMGLSIRNGMLEFQSSHDIPEHPLMLILIFRESARTGFPLSRPAKRLIKEFLYLVDDTFRTSQEALKAFELILRVPSKTFNVLNEMLNTGFLAAYIPEFSKVMDRIQYDEYHIYPVDKHLLRTVRRLKQLGMGKDPDEDPLCRQLYGEISRKELLLWAALLHDIGKGEPGHGHSEKGAPIARDILTAKGYSPEDANTVAFLVKEHLLLMKMATRRDIQDEETAIMCARKIADIDRLKMLYLLTVADAKATGPKAWSTWSQSLVRTLFLNVLNILENGELATSEAKKIVAQKMEAVMAAKSELLGKKGIENLIKVMSPRYQLYVPAEEMLTHIDLYQSLGNHDFVWKIEKSPEMDTRKVTICAKDRPGLFSKLAGTLTLTRVNILNAQVYTWRNNIALDIFEVTPPPDLIFEDEKWEQARLHLTAILSGEMDIEAEISDKHFGTTDVNPYVSQKPCKVVVNNNASRFFTLVEVFAYDFPGLLFKITNALFYCKLDIWVAKIATSADQVVDVFYVRDFDGQKVDQTERETEIIQAIEAILH